MSEEPGAGRIVVGALATSRTYVQAAVRLELVEAPVCWRCGIVLEGLGRGQRELLRTTEGWAASCAACVTDADRIELATLEAQGLAVVRQWTTPTDLQVPDRDPRQP